MKTSSRIVSIACFVFLLIPILALAAWLCFAYLASGSPIPKFLTYRMVVLIAMIISLCAYFKWPFVAAAVAWIDMLMVVFGIFPWEERSISNFLYQFMFDIMFFVAANTGVVLQRFLLQTMHKLGETQTNDKTLSG